MRVLAVGAAGESAGLVTRALASTPVTVRGLVRSADRAGRARTNGADEVAIADLLDPTGLERAMVDVDAVFHVIPAFAPDEARAGVTLVETAVAAGVRRVVFSSVYHPSLRGLSNHRDKQPTEGALYNSALEFTVLQPAMFLSQLDGYLRPALADGVISGPYSAQSRMSYVDYRDVADVAVRALLTDDLVGGTFELSAPGEYSRDDIAAELANLLHREVRATGEVPASMPDDMPTDMAGGLLRMFRHYDDHGLRGGNSVVLASLLGRAPTSVPEYLRRLVDDLTRRRL